MFSIKCDVPLLDIIFRSSMIQFSKTLIMSIMIFMIFYVVAEYYKDYLTTTRKKDPNFYNDIAMELEQQQVEGYLAWKWGVQASLPTTHPYYYQPVVPNLTLSKQIANPFIEITNYIFSPTQIRNCVLWLDGADQTSIVLSGSNVSQWSDKSGSNNHASQATTSNQPTYISSNLVFNGSNFMTLATPSILPSGATINGTFFFVTQSASSAVQVFFMYGPNTMVTGGNPQFYYNSGTLASNFCINFVITGSSISGLPMSLFGIPSILSNSINCSYELIFDILLLILTLYIYSPTQLGISLLHQSIHD